MPVQVYRVFTDWINSLVADNKLLGSNHRAWQGLENLETDTRDVPGLKAPFEREDINTGYEGVYSNRAAPGTVGEAMAAKVQVDYLASAERAFRLRHCSVLRAELHASSRRAGHGRPDGVLADGVLRYVTDLLRSGQAKKSHSATLSSSGGT